MIRSKNGFDNLSSEYFDQVFEVENDAEIECCKIEPTPIELSDKDVFEAYLNSSKVYDDMETTEIESSTSKVKKKDGNFAQFIDGVKGTDDVKKSATASIKSSDDESIDEDYIMKHSDIGNIIFDEESGSIEF